MVTTQVLKSPHRYLRLSWRAAAALRQRCERLDLRCKCLQGNTNSCKAFCNGCGDVAVSRAPVYQVRMFGGSLAAGWRLVQLRRMLPNYMENVKTGSAGVAKGRYGIYVS